MGGFGRVETSCGSNMGLIVGGLQFEYGSINLRVVFTLAVECWIVNFLIVYYYYLVFTHRPAR